MELYGVSFQTRASDRRKKFSRVYCRLFRNYIDRSPDMQAPAFLLEYLETEVDAPPHWVCTSHQRIIFYTQDRLRYGDSNGSGVCLIDWNWVKNRYVIADYSQSGDEITWLAPTVEQAAAIFLEISRRISSVATVNAP